MRFLIIAVATALLVTACPPVRGGGGGGDDDDDGVPDLSFVDAWAECGEGREPGLQLNPTNEAQIEVHHIAVAEGCCPEMGISGEVDVDERTVTVEYDLTNDFCDCVCMLDVGYGIDGLPTGNWTLQVPGGLAATFVVGAR